MGQEMISSPKDRIKQEPVPYMASGSWYSDWLLALLDGADETEARREANSRISLTAKEFSRATVAPDVRLKIPVEGGSSAKRLHPSQLVISDHGDWRHTHLGAISAIFGRAPFYIHIEPWFRETMYTLGDPGMLLAPLSEEIHCRTAAMLLQEGIAPALAPFVRENAELIAGRAADVADAYSSDQAMLAALFRLGPEAIFPLCAAFNL